MCSVRFSGPCHGLGECCVATASHRAATWFHQLFSRYEVPQSEKVSCWYTDSHVACIMHNGLYCSTRKWVILSETARNWQNATSIQWHWRSGYPKCCHVHDPIVSQYATAVLQTFLLIFAKDKSGLFTSTDQLKTIEFLLVFASLKNWFLQAIALKGTESRACDFSICPNATRDEVLSSSHFSIDLHSNLIYLSDKIAL